MQKITLGMLVMLAVVPAASFAQMDLSKVQIKAIPIAGNVHMLEGGGNAVLGKGGASMIAHDNVRKKTLRTRRLPEKYKSWSWQFITTDTGSRRSTAASPARSDHPPTDG